MQPDLVFLITITVTLPKKWELKNMIVKCLGISNQPNAKATLEKLAIERIREAHEKKHPGLNFGYKATSVRYLSEFLVVDDEAPELEITDDNTMTEKDG